jgi:hypothetical protein
MRGRRTGWRSRGGRPEKSGPSPVWRPDARPRQPAHGRRRGSARGRYPPARSWLMAALSALLKSAARRRKEDAAAERREARRWAIPPVISGDPEIGPLARRTIGVRRFRTSACRRSAPPHFQGAEEDKGHPSLSNGPAERWLKDRQCGHFFKYRISRARPRACAAPKTKKAPCDARGFLS